MKKLYFLLLISVSIISSTAAYSQPGNSCSTAVAMNVPDSVWSYCTQMNTGMVYENPFVFDTINFPVDSTTNTRSAWYKFTVPVGKGIHRCIIDFPAYVQCTSYQVFTSSLVVYKTNNCTSFTKLPGGGGSHCYDPGQGIGISALSYTPAVIDSLVEGETYYALIRVSKWLPVDMRVGIKWLPYVISDYNCTTAEEINTNPFVGCNLTNNSFPPSNWHPQVTQCQPNGQYIHQDIFNPVYYTVTPTNDTFNITLGASAIMNLDMYVFKDCAHLGDYSIDTLTGNYKYYYGCSAGSPSIEVVNATPGVPLTLVIDAAGYCGEFVYCPSWDTFSISASGIVMPLKLTSFIAKYNKQDQNVLLSWETESNGEKFTVEKSTNGISFKSIGTVKAPSNAINGKYKFTDDNVGTGKIYYRLRTYDINGKSTYSRIEVVTVAGQIRSAIFPNPATDVLKLVYLSGKNSKVIVTLFNSLGQRQLIITKEVLAGKNKIEFNVSSLTRGVYFLKLKSNEGESVERVLLK